MRWSCALLVMLALVACQSKEDKLAGHAARAAEYIEKEQWPEAKIELLNQIQLDPTNGDVNFELAQVLMRLELFREALFRYQEAVRLRPDNATYRLNLTRFQLQARRYDDVVENANRLIENDPNAVDALILRAQARSRMGLPKESLVDLERAISIEPERAGPYLLLAQILEGDGRKAEAEVQLRKMVEVLPTSASHIALGNFLAQNERGDEALAAYRQAIDLADDPTIKLASRKLTANLMIRLGRLDDAETEMMTAREENPEDSELLLQLARFFTYRGDAGKAETMLTANVEAKSDKVEPRIVLANYYQAQGRADRALEVIDGALEIDPKSVSARLLRSEYLMVARRDVPPFDSGAEAEARRILAEVLAENPTNLEALFTEGKFLIIDGKFREGAERMEQVVSEQPSANAYFLLATAQLRLGNEDQARSALLKALELDGTNLRARAELASLYLRAQEYQQALDEAERALSQRPGNPQLLITKAAAQASLRRNTAAVETLNQVNYARSTRPDAFRLEAARLYARLGQPESARALVEQVLKRSPSNPAALGLLTIIVGQSGDPEGVLAPLDAAIESDPDNAELYALRGTMTLKLRRNGQIAFPERAQADFERAIELDAKRVQAYLGLGELYKSTGRVALAIETFDRALLAVGENPAIMVDLGSLYEAQGNPERALELYDKALTLAPENPIAKNNTAWLLANLPNAKPADLDRALALAQAAKEADPEQPSYSDTLGFVMLKRDLPTAAAGLFRSAIDGFGEGRLVERAQSRFHLGLAYEAESSFAAAIEQFQLAGRDSPAYLAALGEYYERRGQSDKAEVEYKELIAKAPNQVVPYVKLAALYEKQGRLRESIDIYEKLLSYDAQLVAVKNNVAYLLASQDSPKPGDLDRALELGREAFEQLPEDPQIADTLGFVHYKRKSFPEAIEYFQKAVERFSASDDRANARYHLALAHEAAGQTAEARAAIEKALAEAEEFPSRSKALELKARL